MTPSPDPAKLVIFSNKKGCANLPEGIYPGATSVRLLPPEVANVGFGAYSRDRDVPKDTGDGETSG